MMTRETFDRELKVVNEKILRLGNAVEENLVRSVDALVRRNLSASQEMIDVDDWVNNQRIEIIMGCFTLIATQQPTGPDMRSLAATVEIASELERIHDYVKGIGKISLNLGEAKILLTAVEKLPLMATITSHMLQQALEAFSNNDAQLAQSIPAQDNEIDGLFKQISHDLALTVTQDSTTFENANMVQWAVHNLERSADRVINICEWVVYKTTGRYVEMDSEFESPSPIHLK